MQDLHEQIQTHLNRPNVVEEIRTLFWEVLNWKAPTKWEEEIRLDVGTPVSRKLSFQPVAQMAGLPVFRIDWHEPRLPTLTARRAVHRALAPFYAEHLLCFMSIPPQSNPPKPLR
jgi:hypothetical protein